MLVDLNTYIEERSDFNVPAETSISSRQEMLTSSSKADNDSVTSSLLLGSTFGRLSSMTFWLATILYRCPRTRGFLKVV